MSREPEEPWASAMRRVKATNPRNGQPSWNQLAVLSGLTTTTITNLVYGRSKPKVETVEVLAKALRVAPAKVAGWLGTVAPEAYVVPSEVQLLTPRQQKALTELIRAMAEEGGGERGAGSSAPMSGVLEVVPDVAARRDPKGLVDREELRIRKETARLLLPDVKKVGDALAWAERDVVEAADELWVDEETLRVRLRYLHPAERGWLRERLREETWT